MASLTQNGNESMNSILLSKTIISWYQLLQYSYALPDTVPRINVNFRTQLNQWKVSRGIKKINNLSLKIQKTTLNVLQ